MLRVRPQLLERWLPRGGSRAITGCTPSRAARRASDRISRSSHAEGSGGARVVQPPARAASSKMGGGVLGELQASAVAVHLPLLPAPSGALTLDLVGAEDRSGSERVRGRAALPQLRGGNPAAQAAQDAGWGLEKSSRHSTRVRTSRWEKRAGSAPFTRLTAGRTSLELT